MNYYQRSWDYNPDGSPKLRLPYLTPRESEIAVLRAEGLTMKQIALKLHSKLRTVDTHLTHIHAALNIHSALELAQFVHANRHV